MDLSKWISKKDAVMMLDIIQGCLYCRTDEDFLRLMQEFKKLVLFECSNSGWAKTQSILQGKKVECRFISDGYPEEFLNIYLNQGYHSQDHVMQKYFETFELHNFGEVDRCYGNNEINPVISLSHDFGIHEGFVYGVCDRDYYSATGFFLVGRHIENNQRSRLIIECLIPHLSVVIKRLLPFPVNGNFIQLTPTEREILSWFKEGKTTWEISLIMNKSERAIKFHTGNILGKLNAMNKTHAVAIALENKIIHL